MVSILILCNWDRAEPHPRAGLATPFSDHLSHEATDHHYLMSAEVWGSHGDCGARADNFKPIKIWVVNLSRANRINVEWLGWAHSPLSVLSVHQHLRCSSWGLWSAPVSSGPQSEHLQPIREPCEWLRPMRDRVSSSRALDDRQDWKENVNCAQDAATWVYVNLLKILMASGLLCTSGKRGSSYFHWN